MLLFECAEAGVPHAVSVAGRVPSDRCRRRYRRPPTTRAACGPDVGDGAGVTLDDRPRSSASTRDGGRTTGIPISHIYITREYYVTPAKAYRRLSASRQTVVSKETLTAVQAPSAYDDLSVRGRPLRLSGRPLRLSGAVRGRPLRLSGRPLRLSGAVRGRPLRLSGHPCFGPVAGATPER